MKPTIAGCSTKKPKRGGWWDGGCIQKAEAECGSWARRREDEDEGRKGLGEIINNIPY